MEQKTALVTGASEGIGRAFAARLAEAGYSITAVARNQARLRLLIAALPGSGHRWESVDLGTISGIASTARLIETERFNLLINNVGITYYGAFAELPRERQEEILRINCEAHVALAHRFLQVARAGDALVNVSSVLAFLPQPTSAFTRRQKRS